MRNMNIEHNQLYPDKRSQKSGLLLPSLLILSYILFGLLSRKFPYLILNPTMANDLYLTVTSRLRIFLNFIHIYQKHIDNKLNSLPFFSKDSNVFFN